MNKLFFILVIFLLACTSEQTPPFVLPLDAVTLLAGTNSKIWKLAKRTNNSNRMNMGDCFLSYKVTYKVDMTVTDNNGEHPDCGDSLHAQWELTKDKEGHNFIKMRSPQISKLMNIKEDYKLFKVMHLTHDKMKIAYYHKQFSDRTTTIVDYLVPEDVEVKDRDFHW